MTKRLLPPLGALRAFEAFARLGQMTLAADELCVTHGAVSRKIRSLERDTGLRLTDGPRHKLRLTDAGQRLAASLSSSFDHLERCFAELKSAAEQELRLSCVGTFAIRWLIPRLQSFHARHPEFRVKVTESFAAVDFARQPLDAAIRLAEHVPAHGVEALCFLENYHGPVVAPALLAQGAGIEPLPRLHTRPHLTAWTEWEAHTGVRLDHAPEDREFEHLFYMLEAAAAGLGVGLSPWIYVAGDIASGRLAAPHGFVRTPARFFLLLPDETPKPAAAAFRDWLVEEAAAAPAPPALALQPAG